MLYLALMYAALASEDYAAREHAERALVRLADGWPHRYGPRLEQLAAGATSPEVAARCRRPVGVYRQHLAAAYVPTGIAVWPCIDSWPQPVGFGAVIHDGRTGWQLWGRWRPPSVNAAASRQPYWHPWRRATEAMARDMIRRGVPAAEVDYLLVRMARVERSHLTRSHQDETLAVYDAWAAQTEWRGGYPPLPPEPADVPIPDPLPGPTPR